MKKCIAAILAVLYLSTSMGATVHLHYCMGKLAAWTLQEPSGKDGSMCGMTKMPASNGCSLTKKDCCRDEYHQIRTGKDQKPGSFAFEIIRLAAVSAELPDPAVIVPYISSVALTLPAVNGPPIDTGVPVFLRNCNFRI
jgi:hypothetical protein